MRYLVRIGIIAAALFGLAACGVNPQAPAMTTADRTTARTTHAPEQITHTDKPVVAHTAKTAISTAATSPPATESIAVTVVIPEGFSFYQVAQRLEANGVCPARAFYRVAQVYEIQSFDAPYSPEACYALEGFLFPDTYEFYRDEDPAAVLRKFLNNYAAKSGLPDYDTLILASIIEREARSDGHMAMVSSVFHNRLRKGMKLQADATREYVEKHLKPCDFITYDEKYADFYNTYKCRALPAGPICNPGIRAINAALNPSQSDYLYYFFGNDNTNHYTKTYEEHKAAMAEYGVNYGS